MRLDKFRPVRPLVGLFVLPLAGCNLKSLNALYTAGSVSAQQRDLIIITAVLMLFVFIPVVFFTLFFAWRYRASNEKAKYSPNWSHSRLLEVFLWGGPIVIIAILGVLTWNSTHALDPYKGLVTEGDKDPVRVDAIALSWKWLFIYPEYNVAAVNEMAMPVDTPISMRITSDTAMNAIMIPRLGSQIFAMSGMRTKLNLVANQKGRFFGKNYQYTGEHFAAEKFQAVAMGQQRFKEWIQNAKASGQNLDKARFASLTKPSHIEDVIYFAPVKSQLLDHVVQQYNNGTPRNRLTKTAER